MAVMARRSTLVVLALACLGCVSNVSIPQLGDPETSNPRPRARPQPSVLDSRFAPLKGVLEIPASIELGAGVSVVDASLISDRGSGLISDRGGALISDRGAGLLANNSDGLLAQGGTLQTNDTRYGLQQADALRTARVKGARVYLADATGRGVPLLTATQTLADGSFEMPQVPVGFSFVLVVEVPTAAGKTARFQTLVRVGAFGATTEVGAASTLVTASVLDGLNKDDLGDYNSSRFETAIDAVSKRLSDKKLPDFSEKSSIKASIEQLADEVAELREAISDLRKEMAEVKQSLDKLSEILSSSPQPTPAEDNLAPGATASSTPASSPSITPTADPTSSPSAKPTSSPSATSAPGPASAGSVITLAGSTFGFLDGLGDAAKFNGPEGVAVDASGNLYVADRTNHRIRKVTPEGVVTTLAGSSSGFADGSGDAARFNEPSGIAVDGSGNLYIADKGNHRIRKVTPEGAVTTLAGSFEGRADGTGDAARFNEPSGIAVDGSGNLYIADKGNHRIRKVTPAGVVTTLAGSFEGSADGTGTAARFEDPSGIAVDGSGNLYIADKDNHRIRKVTPAGVVTTLAGSFEGFADGTGTAARFKDPSGIAVDGSGNLYIADKVNHRIRKVTPEGVVTTLAGSTEGFADGTGTAARFKDPSGIAIDGSGNLYIADRGNHRIRKIR